MDNRNVYDDGFTLHGFIAPTPLHGACSFSYRPMLAEDTEDVEVFRDFNSDKPREVMSRIIKELSTRIVAWSEVDKDGNSVEINKESIRRIKYKVLAKMYRIVAGLEASEVDPSRDNGDEESDVKSLRELEGN